jgi:hypothetical protein
MLLWWFIVAIMSDFLSMWSSVGGGSLYDIEKRIAGD